MYQELQIVYTEATIIDVTFPLMDDVRCVYFHVALYDIKRTIILMNYRLLR